MSNNSKELTTTPEEPIKDLFSLVKQGDPTTLSQIKESATGPLIIYVIKCIDAGDTKRSSEAMKLLDLIHKYSPKTEGNTQTDYSVFIDNLKK